MIKCVEVVTRKFQVGNEYFETEKAAKRHINKLKREQFINEGSNGRDLWDFFRATRKRKTIDASEFKERVVQLNSWCSRDLEVFIKYCKLIAEQFPDE